MIIKRTIFAELEAHLSQKQITVITGMRRVGKSMAVRFLLEKIEHDNKIYLDLERIENRYIFQQNTYKDVQIELEIQGINFENPAVIALDEIHLVPQITSVLKYFYDTFSIKFIVTGSSSFYFKNLFSESLAGRKHIFEMYPLDFQEFVRFKGDETPLLENFFRKNFQQGVYLKYKVLYEEYCQFGGFPEVVLTKEEKYKEKTILDVVNAYINLDIRLFSDISESKHIYNLLRLLAVRSGNVLEVSKLASTLGLSRAKINDYLTLLEKTYFIYLIHPFSKNADKEISKSPKVYLADTGILQILGQVNSGQVFENQVFLQLLKQGTTPKYYRKRSGQEIDFILDGKHAFEVKETPTEQDLHQVKKRAKSIDITAAQLIGRHQPLGGFSDFLWAGNI